MKGSYRRNLKIKKLAVAFAAVMIAACLSGCGKNITVTVQDGSQVYVYHGEPCTLEELLKTLGVSVGMDDEVSMGLKDKINKNADITIGRRCEITVIYGDEEKTVSVVGGKVRDVLKQLGILDQIDGDSFSGDAYVFDGMKLVVNLKDGSSSKAGKVVEEDETIPWETPAEEETWETEAPAENGEEGWEDWNNWDYWEDDYYYEGHSDDYYVPVDDGGGQPEEPEPVITREVVSTEYYYDCDGSGHGVMVITYSDGSQEEVPF